MAQKKIDGPVVLIFSICGIFQVLLFDTSILLLFMDKANLFYRFVCDWCVILSLTPWAKLNQTSGKKKKTLSSAPALKNILHSKT